MGSMNNIKPVWAKMPVLAIADVADFLLEEGDVLRDLLDLFDEMEAADKTVDLAELCREEGPNVRGIMIALGIILEALEQVSAGMIDQLAHSGQGPRELDKAVLWYGAKVSDLLNRFRI